MNKTAAVLLINLVSTWFMVGLTWLVQLVHYPLFAKVGAANWDSYHRQHMQAITVIIAPVMFVEAISAAVLVFAARPFPTRVKVFVWIAALLVVVNWLLTAGVAVPLHNKLGNGFDPDAVRQLVNVNWLRTAAWTARGVLIAWATWIVVCQQPHSA